MTAAAAQAQNPNPLSPPAPDGPPEPALDKIENWIESFYELLPNIAVGGVVFLIFFVLGAGLRWLVWRWGRRRGREILEPPRPARAVQAPQPIPLRGRFGESRPTS